MKRDWIWVLAACILVYANSTENGFHYDDEHSLQKNVHIRDLANVSKFFKDPSMFSVDHDKGMYRPVLLLSYALNYHYGQYGVTGYHWVNILLHAANAIVLWALVVAMGRGRFAALAAGLLFALHPLGSEPVNYISSRSESLAAFFYLTALLTFVLSRNDAVDKFKVISWLALAAGLMSKSSAITLPAILLVYDYLFLSNFDLAQLQRNFIRRHLGYWLIVAEYLRRITQNDFLPNSLSKRVRGMDEQILTQLKAFVYYIKLIVWPQGLNVEHQFRVADSANMTVLLALLLLVSSIILLLWAYQRRLRAVVFFCLWPLISLAPVMIMPLNVLVNERRLYLPTAAFCVGLALLLHSAYCRRQVRMALIALAVFYAGLTGQRNTVWKDNFSLWGDAVKKSPQMPRVHLYMGNTHKDVALLAEPGSPQADRHWSDARVSYRRAIELQPRGGDLALRALNNLGAVSFKLRDIDAAEKAYRRAVELNPDYADALVNLGTIYHERGRVERVPERSKKALTQAVEYYRRALRLLPNHSDAWANMGLAYFDLGDLERTKKAYDQALYLNQYNPNLINNLGNYYATVAQRTEGEQRRINVAKARQYYQQAIRLNPNYEAPRRGLQLLEKIFGQ